jgi:hypothetical protein
VEAFAELYLATRSQDLFALGCENKAKALNQKLKNLVQIFLLIKKPKGEIMPIILHLIL